MKKIVNKNELVLLFVTSDVYALSCFDLRNGSFQISYQIQIGFLSFCSAMVVLRSQQKLSLPLWLQVVPAPFFLVSCPTNLGMICGYCHSVTCDSSFQPRSPRTQEGNALSTLSC